MTTGRRPQRENVPGLGAVGRRSSPVEALTQAGPDPDKAQSVALWVSEFLPGCPDSSVFLVRDRLT